MVQSKKITWKTNKSKILNHPHMSYDSETPYEMEILLVVEWRDPYFMAYEMKVSHITG